MIETMTAQEISNFESLLTEMMFLCRARLEEPKHDNYSTVIEILDNKIFETAKEILLYKDLG